MIAANLNRVKKYVDGVDIRCKYIVMAHNSDSMRINEFEKLITILRIPPRRRKLFPRALFFFFFLLINSPFAIINIELKSRTYFTRKNFKPKIIPHHMYDYG